LFDVFDTAHRDFIDTSRRMSTLTLLSDQSRILSEMQRAEQALYDRVAAVRDQPRLVADIADDYVQLAELARSLDASGREVVIRETTSMQSLSGEVHNFIYWQLVALIPVALFLVTGATLLILRPIKQIESSLHRLGEGDFNHPVRVSGPRDLEDLGRQIDWVRVRLVELEEQKTRFLHQMSHELKTPLSAIREGTELLGDGAVGPLSAQQAEVAGILHENALRLQRLIEDLLNYHTVQFQKSGLHLNQIDLASVIKRVAEAHRLPMRAKDLSLSISCQPVAFQADENKLEVIIDNLLSNAVKFSPPDGEIVVSARRRGSELLLSVKDEGPGIPVAERERVFEPFFQGVATPQGSIKGTGLGLAIVREYVTAHSGRVEILDVPGAGAHIQVRLPLAPAGQAKA
jgi:two-component system sensor histidine kinase GlrK